jgi:hypothetical protein
MGALAQLAPIAAPRELQTKWAAAPKALALVRKIRFEVKAPWKTVATVAVVRIVMVTIQQRLVKEDPTRGLRLCVAGLGHRGVHDGASFFLRRRIR